MYIVQDCAEQYYECSLVSMTRLFTCIHHTTVHLLYPSHECSLVVSITRVFTCIHHTSSLVINDDTSTYSLHLHSKSCISAYW